LNDKRDDGFRIFFFLSRESFLKPLPDKASRSLHCWILDLTGKVRINIQQIIDNKLNIENHQKIADKVFN